MIGWTLILCLASVLLEKITRCCVLSWKCFWSFAMNLIIIMLWFHKWWSLSSILLIQSLLQPFLRLNYACYRSVSNLKSKCLRRLPFLNWRLSRKSWWDYRTLMTESTKCIIIFNPSLMSNVFIRLTYFRDIFDFYVWTTCIIKILSTDSSWWSFIMPKNNFVLFSS